DRKSAREYELKATRVAEAGSPDIDHANSMLAFFDADDLRAKGIVDRNGYAHAVTLDPQNQAAKDALALSMPKRPRGRTSFENSKRRSQQPLRSPPSSSPRSSHFCDDADRKSPYF
ncbi:MAG: hypothetical protein ABI183_06480, partial [Polyangiaceae bacterium]